MSKKDARKFHVKKRCFLNRDFNMTAFAVGIVEDTRGYSDEDEDDWKWGKIELMFADCNRKVCFDFDMNNAEDRANSLFKIRHISQIVNAVKDALEIEAKSISKRKPPKKIEKTAG
jgi:hypothetical protein